MAFSCKRRGFGPSCGARRMAETAALLVDNVLPQQPVRQWVLSLSFALRYLLATRPEVVTQVLGTVYRAISGHLIRKAGLTRAAAVMFLTSRLRLFLALKPEGLGDLALAGGCFGRLDEFDNLLARRKPGRFLCSIEVIWGRSAMRSIVGDQAAHGRDGQPQRQRNERGDFGERRWRKGIHRRVAVPVHAECGRVGESNGE